MRRRARVDATHAEIVSALRQVGCVVQSLAEVGGGCPDLLVGFRGRTLLIEVKRPLERRDKRVGALREEQAAWAARWRGVPVLVARSVAEALACLREAPAPILSGTLLTDRRS